jgi:H+-translocating NAD(P) transhydrogenase
MTYLVSAGASIAAIGCLANQKTARVGNALGMMGVTGGIAATAGLLAPSAAVTAQLVGSLGLGVGAGSLLARQMKITELPQMVAAFHSLVRAPRDALCRVPHLPLVTSCTWAFVSCLCGLVN